MDSAQAVQAAARGEIERSSDVIEHTDELDALFDVPRDELLRAADRVVEDEALGETDAEPPDERTETGEPDPTPLNLPTGPSKTAVTPQQISLPKGEGSIKGMGESFTPNLSSGTGTFSVPIALPKGRAGVQPSLSMSYSTSGGNGPLGLGWSLAVPFIARQTDKGLPQYVDEPLWHAREDRFVYNGGQELVPVDSAAATRVDGAPVPSELAGWQQYRARVEGGFMRFFRAPDSSRWVVQSKDGTRFEFGACNASACEDAVQADPEDHGRISAWQLVRMSDVHGSAVHYRYLEHEGALYIENIYYTSPSRCGVPNAPVATRDCSASLEDYAHHVHLVYGSRPDVTTSYVSGWRVAQAKRLSRIEVTSAGDPAGARHLVRRYHLRYDPTSYHSLLASVQVEGRPSRIDASLGVNVGDASVREGALGAAIVGELLPPMRFGYTKPTGSSAQIEGFGAIDPSVHESVASPDHSADEGRVDLFDVNADGLTDVLVTDPARFGGGAGVYFNGFAGGVPSQAGAFSDPVRVEVPTGLTGTLNLGSLNIVPMDVDGDGHADILHMPRAANYGYFVLSKTPSRAGSAYAPLHGWAFHHVTDLLPRGVTDPRIDLGKDGEHIKTLDVNNDRLIDVMRTTGTSVQTWLNLGRYPEGEGRFGSATWTGTTWELSTAPIESCLPFAGMSFDLAAPGARIADMNGDGLADLVKVAPDEVVWWPGRGPGVWGEGARACDSRSRSDREIRMENPPHQLNAELAGLELVDINEDGAADLVQVGSDHLSVWFNQGGHGFSKRLLVENTPFAASALDRVRVADIDGSGTTDIVFADAGRWRWIDPMGGVKPRLLETVDNGLGALTTLGYSSSIVDYLRDLADAKSCNPADLDCFTWQRELTMPGEDRAACDARVEALGGGCVHRAGGSPVVSTVVRSVTTTDRLSALGAEESVTQTEYRYHDGYYEGIEQEFRGFGAADAIAIGDAYEPTSTTRTYFHQGRRPNEIATDRLADNPNEALKGREFLTETRDERGVYLSTSHATYAVRKLLTGLDRVDVSYAYVKASDEYRYDTSLQEQQPLTPMSLKSVVRETAASGLNAVANSAPQAGDGTHSVLVRHTGYARMRTTIEEVDNVGNLRTQVAWGRYGRGEFGEAVDNERIVQRADPVRIDDRACGGTGWLWRTAAAWVEDGVSTTRLGSSTSAFSACGDQLAATRSVELSRSLDFSGDSRTASYTQGAEPELASTLVDAWGQPVLACAGADLRNSPQSACLRLSRVVFDTAYAELPVEEAIAVDEASGGARFLSTSASWDRGLGVLQSATDPNGYVSEVSYDGLGHLTSTVAPNVSGCQGRIPTTRIVYRLTDSAASEPLSRVTTTTVLSCTSPDSPDSQIVAHAYVDGLGRPRAALAQGDSNGRAWEDGAGHAWTKSGRQVFSRKGKPWLSYQPVFYEGSPDDYRAVLARPAAPYTRVLYDGFGRPTLEINEDNTFRTRSYHALSADLCDENDNDANAASHGAEHHRHTCTTERMDGHGRVIDQHQRQVTMDGRREEQRLFTYYRADGAVTHVVRGISARNTLRPDNGSTGLYDYVVRRFYYDTLGRRIASDDPDTDNRDASASRATWRYLFNRVGDLAAVRDPRGCGQNFYYDLAGRLIGEAYVGCAEAQGGEAPTEQVPAGSIGLDRIGAAVPVHVRNFFDAQPSWARTLVPAGAGVLGRATASADRGQRSTMAYDARGNVVSVARQMALMPDEATLDEPSDSAERPAYDASLEIAAAPQSVLYDEAHTYARSARYDHAGRTIEVTYPPDPDFPGGNAPTVRGLMSFHRTGAPKRAELAIDGERHAVVDELAYTRDGLVARTRYGDGGFTGRRATESTTLYDARRRPIELFTSRGPATDRTPGTLGAVHTLLHQRLSWDPASNLYIVEDRRDEREWPVGHKPYDQHIWHDSLYHVQHVRYTYETSTGEDQTTDWRDEEARHAEHDPMRPHAAPMLAEQPDQRVMDLEYHYGWLANMTYWGASPDAFYERGIGNIINGVDMSSGGAPAHRPGALYLARNLNQDTPEDLGGWLELDYGVGGNVLAMTVHGRCTHAHEDSCRDPGGADVDARQDALREGCACASEQHYVYRWDELNRLHEARRYDRESGAAWTFAARQRYRYDGANQRTVKQVFALDEDDTDGVVQSGSRFALSIYPGDFERRGLELGDDGYYAEGRKDIAQSAALPPTAQLDRWYRADSCHRDERGFTVCDDRTGHAAASYPVLPNPSIADAAMGGQPALVFAADTRAIGVPAAAGDVPTNEFAISMVVAIDAQRMHYPLWAHDTYRADGSRYRSVLYAVARASDVALYFASVENYGEGADERFASRLEGVAPRGTPFIVTVRGTPSASELYVDGALVDSDGPTCPTQSAVMFGSAGDKRIAEVLLYRGAIDDESLARVHRYAAHRYGISMHGAGGEAAAAPPSFESDSETQYLVAGARLVWKNRSDRSSLIDPEHRITIAVTNLIQSTSAVIDLVSGELLEVGGFYPNGAREEWLSASDEVGGAQVPLEPAGFTGKEADEEVGLTYFGERYLIPRIGRWATPDPLAIHAMGGGEGLNSFHYVSGNLLQARDPLGLAAVRANAQMAAQMAMQKAYVGAIVRDFIDTAKLAINAAVSLACSASICESGGAGGFGLEAQADEEVANARDSLAYAATHPIETGTAFVQHVVEGCSSGSVQCAAVLGSVIGIPSPTKPLGMLDDIGRAGLRALKRATHEGGALLELRHASGLRSFMHLDGKGRVASAHASITDSFLGKGTRTDDTARAITDMKNGRVRDHAGHIMAKIFGGGIDADNLVPQLSSLNQGKISTLEKQIAGFVRNGETVDVEISLKYGNPDAPQRPTSIEYSYSRYNDAGQRVGGDTRTFPNE